MVRPTIRRKNLVRTYQARARALTREWTGKYRGIEAVMLTGGVARGYADEGSELDLTLFLRPVTFRHWVERCQAPLPEGDNLVGSWWVDLVYTTIEGERGQSWSPLTSWDRSFAHILYDPSGRLASLLREKIRPHGDRWSLHQEALTADWYMELGEEWVDRTDIVAGHHLLNLSFDHFLSLLYRAQGEWVPFDKWTFHLSRSLRTLPPTYVRDVRGWMEVRAMTRGDIERRARHAERMLSWWKGAFPEAWLHSQTRDAIELLRKGPMDLDDFDQRIGRRVLLQYPLRAVTSVERRGRSDAVILDAKRLDHVLRVGEAGMHPYQLARLQNAVRRVPNRRQP